MYIWYRFQPGNHKEMDDQVYEDMDHNRSEIERCNELDDMDMSQCAAYGTTNADNIYQEPVIYETVQ